MCTDVDAATSSSLDYKVRVNHRSYEFSSEFGRHIRIENPGLGIAAYEVEAI